MAKIGSKRPGADVFAWGEGNGVKLPILVAMQVGAGRTMAFGGDTTWRAWRRSESAVRAYERFWKQVILWLARRENASGSTFVIPDRRRVEAGQNKRVGFSVGVRGKGGVPLPDAKFEVWVESPDGKKTVVETAREGGQQRGYFDGTSAPGDYAIWVKASGTDTDGKELNEKPAKAGFICFAEDVEGLRSAADHDFLEKLAREGRGTAYVQKDPKKDTSPDAPVRGVVRVQKLEDGLAQLLDELLARPLLPSRARSDVWPNWRQTPVSLGVGDQVAAMWASGLLPAFVLFVTFVSLEWFLRRRWEMV
jgi:hypothetical protein